MTINTAVIPDIAADEVVTELKTPRLASLAGVKWRRLVVDCNQPISLEERALRVRQIRDVCAKQETAQNWIGWFAPEVIKGANGKMEFVITFVQQQSV
jgi:hypothetical protein